MIKSLFQMPEVAAVAQKQDKNGNPYLQLTLRERSKRVVTLPTGETVETQIPVEQRATIRHSVNFGYLAVSRYAAECVEKVNAGTANELETTVAGAESYREIAEMLRDTNSTLYQTFVPKATDYKVGEALYGTVVEVTVAPYTINSNGRSVTINYRRVYVPFIDGVDADFDKKVASHLKAQQIIVTNEAKREAEVEITSAYSRISN